MFVREVSDLFLYGRETRGLERGREGERDSTETRDRSGRAEWSGAGTRVGLNV